ncbi:metallophosphoesterase family protein [Candidatus Foliamicus sp.]
MKQRCRTGDVSVKTSRKSRKVPKAPRGTRVYAIGDLHGRLDPLTRLMAEVRRDARTATENRRVLIFLGDYVDRGLQSRQVVDFLLEDPAPGFEIVFLKGNHEALLLDFLADAGNRDAWLDAGGNATLLSYGIKMPPQPRSAAWLESVRSAFCEALPDTHRSFLSGLATKHVEGDYAFAHGGIRPGTAFEEQQEQDLLWGSEEFLKAGEDHGKIIVHGHSFSPEPVVTRNRIGIDTGAYATGRLTCLVLQGAAQRFLFS